MQSTMGSCLVMVIDRLLQRTGSDALLREFYESAKKATIFQMNLRPEYGIRQVISQPTGNGTHWFDGPPWCGMVPHIGGLHLAHLQIMKRLAEKIDDTDFVRQCDEWLIGGSQVLDDELWGLWTGSHYLTYSEPETGKVSEPWLIFGPQLEGQWVSRFHGLRGVFQSDRMHKTLDTLARANANENLSPYGAILFAKWDGAKATKASATDGHYGDSTHAPSTMMLAMNYMYTGDDHWYKFGVDLLWRTMNNLVNRQGVTWALPIFINATTGAPTIAVDDYQNMMLWSVPAALKGQDLTGPCRPGGLVDRMVKAAKGLKTRDMKVNKL